MTAITDGLGRGIDYLRISITDRCNLRCLYCMPAEGVKAKRHDEILSFEEIERLVGIVAQMGIKHIRLTGGEPLVRPGVVDLVRMIAHTPGVESVALTTNGLLLPKLGPALAEAGLSRVNISLDTLNPEQYQVITRIGSVQDALDGVEAALACGFDPVKINTVVVRQLNQDLYRLARLSIGKPLHVRFIEYMPVGVSAGPDGLGWSAEDTVPSEEVLARINAQAQAAGEPQLTPVRDKDPHSPTGWGPARYYRFEGALGTVGFISALSNHFCSTCNRIRLTADGKVRPCLFSDQEFDIRTALATTTGWAPSAGCPRSEVDMTDSAPGGLAAGTADTTVHDARALTHVNEKGEVRMVDVSEKDDTKRTATAEGFIAMHPDTLAMICEGRAAKGDVLACARVAGIMGAKSTSQLIPMCHPLPMTKAQIDTTPVLAGERADGRVGIRVTGTTKVTGKTGIEMEALTGVSIALLTIYDMCKAVDRGMEISEVHLLRKEGGKTGLWTREGKPHE